MKRTRKASAPSRTSTRWRMRKGCCAPASTRSRTTYVTRTSMTSSWRSSRRTRTSSSVRTCRSAA
jgi:hypothetical protein